MDRFNHYLSHAIVQLVFTLAPDAVVLGTISVAAGEELCFAPLRQKVDALLWPQLRGGLRDPAGSAGRRPPVSGRAVCSRSLTTDGRECESGRAMSTTQDAVLGGD
jgi:predicted NBD/HSP70 family sugar kinase